MWDFGLTFRVPGVFRGYRFESWISSLGALTADDADLLEGLQPAGVEVAEVIQIHPLYSSAVNYNQRFVRLVVCVITFLKA
jgi:hypothetical protein